MSEMNERVIFPLLTALNTPSYLLEAVRTLLALGVPEKNLRLLPLIAHFASPEICAQEPPGPDYDPKTGRATVRAVVPAEVRPRLTVSVRSETVMRFWEDAGGVPRHDERIMGRLAHFLPPVMAGIPGVEPEGAARPEDPLDRMTRHVAAVYPELLATLPPAVQEDLSLIADEIMALLAEPAGPAGRRAQYAAQALQHVANSDARAACRAVFAELAEKVHAETIPGAESGDAWAARSRFLRWMPLVLVADADAPRLIQAADALSEAERTEQRAFWQAFQTVVYHETRGGRLEIIRELMEILTTTAFLTAAGLDAMNGISYLHGSLRDVCEPSPAVPDGLLFSVTGGRQSRGILMTLMQEWAQSPDGLLGVRWPTEDAPPVPKGKRAPPPEPGSLRPLDEGQRLELLSLMLWRRETGDVRAVLELAAQRLIHPGIAVSWETFQPASSRVGTLLAQPGQTAALGGPALLLFPGLLILMPFSEDADADATRAKAVLALLQRLFIPVTCRVEVVWQETIGRLTGGSFLQHDFQSGVRLADAWTALTQQTADEDDRLVP